MSLKYSSALTYVCQPFKKIFFFSETAGLVKAKLHVELPWEWGMKVCINGQGHMTKMTASMYDNYPSKIFFVNRFQRNLLCSIGVSGRSKFVSK